MIIRRKGISDKKQEKTKEENRDKVIKAVFELGNNISPSDVAKMTGLDRMTVYRHMKTLREDGFLEGKGCYTHKSVYFRTTVKGVIRKILNLKGFWSMHGLPDVTGITTVRSPKFPLDERNENKIRKIIEKSVDFNAQKDEQCMIAFIVTKRRNKGLRRTALYYKKKIEAKELAEIKKKQKAAGIDKLAPKIMEEYEKLQKRKG